MKGSKNRNVFGACLLAAGLLTSFAAGLGATAVDPTAEINRQFQAMLAQMRKPQANGVLVTEVGPLAAAGRAGVRAGDIITHYAGTETRTVDALRTAVADALAAREVSESTGKLLMSVRRGDKEEVLQMPREPLGIRAIQVEVGVPATMNPAPSARGTVTLTWNADHFLNGEPQWYRVYEDGIFSGWQTVKSAAIAAGERSEVEIATTRIEVNSKDDPDGDGITILSKTHEKVGFRPGDYATSTPFQLDSVAWKDNSRGAEFSSSGERLGGKLSGHIKADKDAPPLDRTVEMPLNTITPAGARMVAAAMPLEKGHVLGFSLVTGWDLIPRPGYVIATRGKQKVGEGEKAEELFRVDLMHAGTSVETYWITPGRQIARIEMHSGTKREALRVGNELDAKLTTMPATRPR